MRRSELDSESFLDPRNGCRCLDRVPAGGALYKGCQRLRDRPLCVPERRQEDAFGSVDGVGDELVRVESFREGLFQDLPRNLQEV